MRIFALFVFFSILKVASAACPTTPWPIDPTLSLKASVYNYTVVEAIVVDCTDNVLTVAVSSIRVLYGSVQLQTSFWSWDITKDGKTENIRAGKSYPLEQVDHAIDWVDYNCTVPVPTNLTECQPGISKYASAPLPVIAHTNLPVNPTVKCFDGSLYDWRITTKRCYDAPDTYSGIYDLDELVPQMEHLLEGAMVDSHVLSIDQIWENEISNTSATWSVYYATLNLLDLSYKPKEALIYFTTPGGIWHASHLTGNETESVGPDKIQDCALGIIHTIPCITERVHAGTWAVSTRPGINSNATCLPDISIISCSSSPPISSPVMKPSLFSSPPFEFWPISGGCALSFFVLLGTYWMK